MQANFSGINLDLELSLENSYTHEELYSSVHTAEHSMTDGAYIFFPE